MSQLDRTRIRRFNFAQMPIFFPAWDSLTSLKSQTLSSQLKVPSGWLVLCIFTSWKNPSTSDGFEFANPRPPRPTRLDPSWKISDGFVLRLIVAPYSMSYRNYSSLCIVSYSTSYHNYSSLCIVSYSTSYRNYSSLYIVSYSTSYRNYSSLCIVSYSTSYRKYSSLCLVSYSTS